MAHPDQQAHAVLALRLEHGAIAFVVDELRQLHPLLRRCSRRRSSFDPLAERRAALRAVSSEKSCSPHMSPCGHIAGSGIISFRLSMVTMFGMPISLWNLGVARSVK